MTQPQEEALNIIRKSKSQSSMLGNRNWDAMNMIHNSCGMALERAGFVTLKLGGDGNLFAHLNNDPDQKYEFEYLDREQNCQCLGTFEKVPTFPTIPEEKWIGRRMIVLSWKDSKTMLPVLMKIVGIAGCHFIAYKHGAHAVDLCYIETE